MKRIHTYVEFEVPTVNVAIDRLKAAGYLIVARGDCWLIVDNDAAIAIRNIIWMENGCGYCLVNTIDPDDWDVKQFVEIHCPG